MRNTIILLHYRGERLIFADKPCNFHILDAPCEPAEVIALQYIVQAQRKMRIRHAKSAVQKGIATYKAGMGLNIFRRRAGLDPLELALFIPYSAHPKSARSQQTRTGTP